MATAPVKSPLHNFPLPFLKWGGKNHTNNNHRCRRPISAESSPVSEHCEHETDRNESEGEATRPHRVDSRTVRNRFAFSSCSAVEKSQKQQQQSEREHNEIEDARDGKQREVEEAEAEDTVQKPWNLRPRRGLASKAPIVLKNGELQELEVPGGSASGGHQQHQSEGQNPQPKSLRLRGFAESQSTEKKEKRKFWIALSKDEIEEDIFVMTGNRPSRRPKKRPKNIQKQLDVTHTISLFLPE